MEEGGNTWLNFLLVTLRVKSLSATQTSKLQELPDTTLEYVLSMAGPWAVLQTASCSSAFFCRICSSRTMFDLLHFQTFGCYLPSAGEATGSDSGGEWKTLFYNRLFRSIHFSRKKIPTMIALVSTNLAKESDETGGNSVAGLPPLQGGLRESTSATRSTKAPFCSVLCPPPKIENKFDGEVRSVFSSNSGDERLQSSWRLFVGRASGDIEVHSLRLDEGCGSSSSSSSKDESYNCKQDASSLGILTPTLAENVLCMCLDTFHERLYAGGDGGVVRCWDTKTLQEITTLGENFIAWKGKMQDGALAVYSIVHFDPYEDRRRSAARGFAKMNAGSPLGDYAGRGNLVLGNLNGDVVIWDLEAMAVSAVLVAGPSESSGGEYFGACNGVAIARGLGEGYIVGLSSGGRGVCIWPTNGIWDAVPEVKDSVVYVTPSMKLALNGIYTTLLVFPNFWRGSAGNECKDVEFSFAVGNSRDPLIRTYTFSEESMKAGESKAPELSRGRVLSWNAGEAYALLEDGEEGERGEGLGTSSMTMFGNSLVAGACDGKVRVWQNVGGLLESDLEEGNVFLCDATVNAVECDGVCPVQGLHSFGGNSKMGGAQALALVSVGWDRTLKVFVPTSFDGQGTSRGEGTEAEVGDAAQDFLLTEKDDDIVNIYSNYEEGMDGNKFEPDADYGLECLLIDDPGEDEEEDGDVGDDADEDEEGEEEEEEEENENYNDGEGEDGDRLAFNYKKSMQLDISNNAVPHGDANMLTDRSNFSVDTATAEIDKFLASSAAAEKGLEELINNSPQRSGRDWRAAMAALDGVLGNET